MRLWLTNYTTLKRKSVKATAALCNCLVSHSLYWRRAGSGKGMANSFRIPHFENKQKHILSQEI